MKGAETALLFAKEGAKVVISARREAQLIDIANKIKGHLLYSSVL